MKAVGLVRSNMQDGGPSAGEQERDLHEFFKARRRAVSRVYREEGTSGMASVARRPVLGELLADSAESEFDVVVVNSMDRLSRSLEVTLQVLAHLAGHGVGVVSVADATE